MLLDELLIKAVIDKDMERIKDLVKIGANVNTFDEYINERTVLVEAVYSGDLEIVKYLVKHGAYITDVAIDKAQNEIKEYLNLNLDFINAVEKGQLNKVESYLKKGGCVNLKDKKGYTALMYAIEQKNMAMIDLLQNNGANLDEGLMFAIKGGNSEIVDYLLKKGGSENYWDEHGVTVLMAAVYYGNIDIVKSLVEKGAYINFQDKNGNTALMFAIESENMEIIKYLVENRAYINYYKNKDGYSGLTYAMAKDNVNIVKYLTDNIVKKDNKSSQEEIARMLEFSEGYSEAVEYLIEHGVEVTIDDGVPVRMLMLYAMKKDNLVMKEYLMNKIRKKGDNTTEYNATEYNATEYSGDYLKNKLFNKLFMGIPRLGQDKKEILRIVNKLLERKDVFPEVIVNIVKDIDIVKNEKGYKIILRKSRWGKAYKRFIYSGNDFIVIKRNEKKAGFNKVYKIWRKHKKLFKKIFRFVLMRKINCNELVKYVQNIDKENLNSKNYPLKIKFKNI